MVKAKWVEIPSITCVTKPGHLFSNLNECHQLYTTSSPLRKALHPGIVFVSNPGNQYETYYKTMGSLYLVYWEVPTVDDTL
jgi:hypothetical protein